MTGYKQNGRITAKVSQHGTPWTGPVYKIRLGEKDPETELYPNEVVNRLTSYETKPSLTCERSVCGKAARFFRSAISSMLLPDAMR